MTHSANQPTTFTYWFQSVCNAASLPHQFIQAHMGRIERAYDFGETPEMIAEEMRVRYSLVGHRPTKTPRQLAKRVVRV